MSRNAHSRGAEVPEGDASHAGRLLRRVTSGVVVLVLVLAGAAFQFDLGPRWFGFDYPSPVTEPAEVAPPAGLSLPEAARAGAVAEASDEVDADPDAVRRAVSRLERSKKLGRDVAVAVVQMSDGEVVHRVGPERVTPASTMKLLTSTAALARLGDDHRFRTRVVTGAGRAQIVLVGGGDPLLSRKPLPLDEAYPARADVQTLARATARSLRDIGRTRVRLGYDDSLFAGPAVSPDWPPSYIPDNVVSPISALWVDEGREPDSYVRSDDPARAAAETFVRALERNRIRVVGRPRPQVADPEATELAAVESAPLDQVVQHVLEVSDNEGAEVLARQVAVAAGVPASFSGAAGAVADTLADLGIKTGKDRILDGSGLSRDDRLRPETLLQVIETAASEDHEELRPVLSSLPVAGFTGSLASRFDTGEKAGLGAVRAKTGTLTGVHGLAGTVTTVDGVVLGFVAVADRVRLPNTLAARATIDRLAAALAACTCAAP
jgi:D-alanyl-D-alanine carboxypeptidase/D-alanyl-D-alanine-endopeptidase (penicillin-binding protein 4)